MPAKYPCQDLKDLYLALRGRNAIEAFCDRVEKLSRVMGYDSVTLTRNTFMRAAYGHVDFAPAVANYVSKVAKAMGNDRVTREKLRPDVYC